MVGKCRLVSFLGSECMASRGQLRDNVVYWKTNGKINNDLQWPACLKIGTKWLKHETTHA